MIYDMMIDKHSSPYLPITMTLIFNMLIILLVVTIAIPQGVYNKRIITKQFNVSFHILLISHMIIILDIQRKTYWHGSL